MSMKTPWVFTLQQAIQLLDDAERNLALHDLAVVKELIRDARGSIAGVCTSISESTE